ncbi:MAG: flagellin [Limnobacter sp.]|nr:flagellin [Limnobacter sp.]
MLGINTNAASLNAQMNLSKSSGTLNTSIERLSSGLRVNSAKDDAAGLAIAERMSAQIRGFDQAQRNANDGVSLLQVADGALGKISDNLQRMRELGVQAKNGTLNATDRANLDREYSELANEVGRIAVGTEFNGNDVFLAANKTVNLQVGAGNAAEDTLALNLTSDGTAAGNDLQTSLGGTTAAAIATAMGGVDSVANATTAITQLDTQINNITNLRATTGAGLSRLEQVAESLQSNSSNLSAARGRIMDADFASETANLTRSQILQQAGTAMLAQANQLPQNVLSLLR